MPPDGLLPARVVELSAAATLFAIMLHLGLGIRPGSFRWVFGHPALLLRALFSALVLVPVIAVAVVWLFRLPLPVEIGIVLMAVSPGAPIALRRSLDAGGHAGFAPALQIALALLAVVTLPVSIALLNRLYAGHASVLPGDLARQVFAAQILPLGLGISIHGFSPNRAEAIARRLDPWAKGLLLAFTVLILLHVSPTLARAGLPTALAIVVVTALALAAGHWLGGPVPETRSAVAIASAMRNPGLALIVATFNRLPAAVSAAVITYLAGSACVILGYMAWRRRRSRSSSAP